VLPWRETSVSDAVLCAPAHESDRAWLKEEIAMVERFGGAEDAPDIADLDRLDPAYRSQADSV